MNVWRWVESGPADGATQMAIDQAMVECAANVGKPTMRVYSWRPYCMSLGYHQSLSDIDVVRCWKEGIDVVKRPTGGRAVFHAEEVTYSVAIPKNHFYYRQGVRQIYNRINRGLLRGIQALGVLAKLQRTTGDLDMHYKSYMAVSCFSATARDEIVVDGKKLVGSAQRRITGGILQHGSIIVGDKHLDLFDYLMGFTPKTKMQMREQLENRSVSIRRCLGRDVNYDEIQIFIKACMAKELDLIFIDDVLTEEESVRAHVLRDRFKVYPDCSVISGE